MTIRHTAVAALSALTLISAAHAGDLKPIQGRSINLGNLSGVAYYTVENDGFHVVTTLAQGEAGTPVRFEATLAPGQRVVLSTPRELGRPADKVEISRHNDRVLVRDAAVTN